jgi:competence protein ComGF
VYLPLGTEVYKSDNGQATEFIILSIVHVQYIEYCSIVHYSKKWHQYQVYSWLLYKLYVW